MNKGLVPSLFSQKIEGSKTLAVTARVAELRQQGRDIIDLGAGEPDFNTPEPACAAAKAAIDAGFTKYTPNPGILELREEIANYLAGYGTEYSPREILVSNGAKQSIYNALLAVCNPGDEVLLPTPYWTSYPQQIAMAGARTVYMPATQEMGFKITARQLAEAITDKTRLIIFNSPSNPTGAVYSRAEMDAIAEVIRDSGIGVISDEIYLELIYGTDDYASFCAYPDLKDQVLIVNGVSKSHAMTGWRIGYLAGPENVIKAAAKVQSHSTSGAASISQKAALAALRIPAEDMQEQKDEFSRRRETVFSLLSSIPSVDVSMPGGAFYIFPDISAYFGRSDGSFTIANSVDFATYILEKAGVAIVPGEAFGAPDNIRISYANSMENLEKAMAGMKAALSELR